MRKGVVEVIFWIAIIIIVLFVFFKFMSSFAEATPELQALNDFKDVVEKVCADGGPTVQSVSLYLPKADDSYFKVHMAGGQVEVYKCSGISFLGCTEKVKSKGLNCPSDIKISNCWAGSLKESTYVTVLKNIATKTVSLNQTEGVSC